MREGGIVPLLQKDGTVELRFYGQQKGVCRYYDDDGESFDYEKGVYTLAELTVTKNGAAGTLDMNMLHQGMEKPLPEFKLRLMTK